MREKKNKQKKRNLSPEAYSHPVWLDSSPKDWQYAPQMCFDSDDCSTRTNSEEKMQNVFKYDHHQTPWKKNEIQKVGWEALKPKDHV